MATAFALTPDPQNANTGTARGAALLGESLDRCGVGRPIVTDSHGTIIGGNKSYAAVTARGLPTELVETSGHELVVVQRTDLDLATDPVARQLAYYDNRTQELDLAWDVAQLQDDVLDGVPVDEVFFPDELRDVLGLPQTEPLPATDGGDVAIPKEPKTKATTFGSAVLTFETPIQLARWRLFLRRLTTRYPDITDPMLRLSLYLDSLGIA